MREIWKAIEWAPTYEVSNLGRVRNKSYYRINIRVLKPKITTQGYHEVRIYTGDGSKYCRVNRLVCEAFHGPAPEGKPFACHKDDIPSNNTPENLYWGSRLDNADDALANERYIRGEASPCSRHSEDTVRTMLSDRRQTGASIDVLSDRYGISRSQVSKIINGQAWSHLHD